MTSLPAACVARTQPACVARTQRWRASAVLVASACLLGLAGCGDEDNSNGAAAGDATVQRQPAKTAAPPRPKGTTITRRNSEFGTMLFDSKRQAIYVFQNDRPNRSRCYGDCAEAWPPVYTRGRPRAGRGVNQALLGTVKRRGGRQQVTYAGKPLYFYAHERPGEVRCHNVNLNGGLWWVVGPDGRRRP